MKYMKTALVAAFLLAAPIFPLQAEQRSGIAPAAPDAVRIQIAEVPPVVRNVTAIRKPSPETANRAAGDTAADASRDRVHPPGAQALMALGIALIVTPAMFGGAFSN